MFRERRWRYRKIIETLLKIHMMERGSDRSAECGGE